MQVMRMGRDDSGRLQARLSPHHSIIIIGTSSSVVKATAAASVTPCNDYNNNSADPDLDLANGSYTPPPYCGGTGSVVTVDRVESVYNDVWWRWEVEVTEMWQPQARSGCTVRWHHSWGGSVQHPTVHHDRWEYKPYLCVKSSRTYLNVNRIHLTLTFTDWLIWTLNIQSTAIGRRGARGRRVRLGAALARACARGCVTTHPRRQRESRVRGFTTRLLTVTCPVRVCAHLTTFWYTCTYSQLYFISIANPAASNSLTALKILKLIRAFDSSWRDASISIKIYSDTNQCV